jgi:hypothetical protein
LGEVAQLRRVAQTELVRGLEPVRDPAPVRRSALRAAVVPFLVSRAIAATFISVSAVVFAERPLTIAEFARFDGHWYTHIADNGYSMDYVPGVQTAWPFFPLLPSVMRTLGYLGIGTQLAGVLLNHVVFLVALAGIHRIACRHGSERSARLAVWATALFPTSFLLTMVYPSAIVLASSVWAFVFVEERRDVPAGVLAAAATLARPNGIIIAITLVIAARVAWRRVPALLGPSLVALAAWLAYVWHRTGDPRTVLWAKDGWREITLEMFVSSADDTLVVVPHLTLAVAVMAALVIERRRVPGAWTALTTLWLVPSFYMGMVGMGRYAAASFPPFVAAGRILERRRRPIRAALFGAAVAGQALACYWVNWVKHWQITDPGLLA